MASYLRPRRGKKTTAENQNIILKKGEVFFEYPDTGVGTGIGKIKMGDGINKYKDLPYFINKDKIVEDLIFYEYEEGRYDLHNIAGILLENKDENYNSSYIYISKETGDVWFKITKDDTERYWSLTHDGDICYNNGSVLKKHMQYYTLYDGEISSTEKSYNTIYDRKFSDYDMIILNVIVNSYNRQSSIIPSILFQSTVVKNELIFVCSNIKYSLDVGYVSDTNFKASTTYTDTVPTLKIIGINIE